jgi:hypothetical protein
MDFDFALLDIQLPDGSGLELPKPGRTTKNDLASAACFRFEALGSIMARFFSS